MLSSGKMFHQWRGTFVPDGVPAHDEVFNPRSLHNFKNSLKSSASCIAIVEVPQLLHVLQPFGRCPPMPIRHIITRFGQRDNLDRGTVKPLRENAGIGRWL